MKVEVGRFQDGNLMVKVVFEPNSNFWKETLTWVPTIKEIELILNTLLGIDVVNRWKKYRRKKWSLWRLRIFVYSSFLYRIYSS